MDQGGAPRVLASLPAAPRRGTDPTHVAALSRTRIRWRAHGPASRFARSGLPLSLNDALASAQEAIKSEEGTTMRVPMHEDRQARLAPVTGGSVVRPDRALPHHNLLALQRAAGNRAVSSLLALQRYSETVPVVGMGSGFSPSQVKLGPVFSSVDALVASLPAYMPGNFTDFSEGRLHTLTLPEGTTGGRLSFRAFESATIVNLVLNDFQFGNWNGVVPFSISGEAITFGAPIIETDMGGAGATLTVTVGSGQTTGGGYTTFNVMVAAAGSVASGGTVGIGPISASAPISTSSTFAGGTSRSFTVNMRLTPPQPITAPDVDFRIGLATLADGQEGAIARWFQGLPAGVQDGIRNGRRAIAISGYASTTSRRRSNRDLSVERAHVVERVLRGFAGSSAAINIFYFGEDAARTADETEDPTQRRATVVVQVPSGTNPTAPGPMR